MGAYGPSVTSTSLWMNSNWSCVAWVKHWTIINTASLKTANAETLTHDGFNIISVQNCETYIKPLWARETSMWEMNKISDNIQPTYHPTRGITFGRKPASLGIWSPMFQDSTVVSSSLVIPQGPYDIGNQIPSDTASHPRTDILSTLLR